MQVVGLSMITPECYSHGILSAQLINRKNPAT